MKKYLWVCYFCVLLLVAFHAAGLDSFKLVPKIQNQTEMNLQVSSINSSRK